MKRNKSKVLLLFTAFLVVSFGFSQVGINTTNPLSTLDINGNLNVKEIGIPNLLVSGSATLFGGSFASKTQINDGVYISIMPSGSNNDFELPDAVLVPGRIYIIRNISNSNYAFMYSVGGNFYAKDSNNLTTEPVSMPHNALFKTLIFISDGQNWTYIF
jgi:hypothetical protein